MTSALDQLPDPLITPLLALLADAANADLSAEMVEAGLTPELVVATTAPHPVALEILGETALPLLACYRVRTRSRRFSIAYVDHTYTLQLAYLTPAAAREQLGARWPLLDRVWSSLLRALRRGRHDAHQAGANVLGPAGVLKVDLATAQKLELFAEAGDFTYPMFRAEVDVVYRSASEIDTSALYPALSFTHHFYVDGGGGEPDAVSVSLTPAGQLVPYERG